MSLDTLLEAAEFLELRSQVKTRVDEVGDDIHHYAKTPGNGSDSSPDTSLNGRSPDPDDKDRRRTGGAGTREVHNKLEKNRRAHLKECFDFLKKQIPNLEDKRTSNLSILRGSLRYIQVLKRKEKEYELEMQLLSREKVNLQDRVNSLKSELDQLNIEVDLNMWMANPEPDTNSTSTATETGSFVLSEDEDEDKRKISNMVVPKPSHVSGANFSSAANSRLSAASTIATLKASLIGKPILSATMTPTMNNPMSLATMSPIRTPVTQILHQTLTQRQALLKQQTSPTQVTNIHAGNIRPASQVIKSIAQVRAPFTLTTGQAMNNASHVAMIPKFGAGTVTVPVTPLPKVPKFGATAITVPVTTLPKVQTQPFFVTATLATTNALTAVLQPIKTEPGVLSASTSSNTNTDNVTMKTTLAQTSTVTMVSSALPSASISSVPTIKQILAPNTQLLTAGQLALNPLLAQTISQANVSTIMNPASNLGDATSVTGATAPAATTRVTPTILPLTQMTPVTQILSPMAVMSPSIQMTGFSPAQLNSVLAAQPLLKQFPLLQPHILQAGQMIGQPVVMTKPLVVMTMPSTTTAPTAAMQVAVTKTS